MAFQLDPDMDADGVAELLRSASEEDVEELLQGPQRAAILDRVLDAMARSVDPERARKVGDVMIQVKVWDRPGGGYDHFELVFRDGECTVSETPSDDPDLILKSRAGDFVRVATGTADAMRLALSGRLRVVGDLGLARKLPKLFPVQKGR